MTNYRQDCEEEEEAGVRRSGESVIMALCNEEDADQCDYKDLSSGISQNCVLHMCQLGAFLLLLLSYS